jgi:hypothetical protein
MCAASYDEISKPLRRGKLDAGPRRRLPRFDRTLVPVIAAIHTFEYAAVLSSVGQTCTNAATPADLLEWSIE